MHQIYQNITNRHTIYTNLYQNIAEVYQHVRTIYQHLSKYINVYIYIEIEKYMCKHIHIYIYIKIYTQNIPNCIKHIPINIPAYIQNISNIDQHMTIYETKQQLVEFVWPNKCYFRPSGLPYIYIYIYNVCNI